MQNQLLESRHDSLSYYLSLQYPIDIYPEDRGFTVMIRDLPGCMSQGKTIDEAIFNINKAKELWLETAYAKDKTSIPLPSK
ncbi:MAG: type II toxin-antitoxin system HicB family antitoxin [Cyanobacteria bacterium P01_G01_bin.19]